MEKNEKTIDRNIIQQAMQNFLKKGGKIKKLPPQKFDSTSVIAKNQWGIYETLGEITI